MLLRRIINCFVGLYLVSLGHTSYHLGKAFPTRRVIEGVWANHEDGMLPWSERYCGGELGVERRLAQHTIRQRKGGPTTGQLFSLYCALAIVDRCVQPDLQASVRAKHLDTN